MSTSSKPEQPRIPVGFSNTALTGDSYTDLVDVHIRTKDGSEYIFPDMSLSVVQSVLPEDGRTPADQPALMLFNVSAALISIPFIIIDTVGVVGQETLWHSNASAASKM